jgi:hypothetical protein
VDGFSASGTAVHGYSNANAGTGVTGATLGGGTGVLGLAGSGTGVEGNATSGTGVEGSATSGNGVEGYSVSGKGVYGENTATSGFAYAVQGVSASTTGRGVHGHATALSGSTNGVVGEVESPSGAGVRAIGSSSTTGTALLVENGRVRALGAGVNTATFAFIHETNGGNTQGDTTCIDNAVLNDHPEAIPIVTPVASGPGLVYNFPWMLYYRTNVNPNKWCIMRQDVVPDGIPTGHRWHVLVVFP